MLMLMQMCRSISNPAFWVSRKQIFYLIAMINLMIILLISAKVITIIIIIIMIIRWVLKQHFVGHPKPEDFDLVEEELPPLQDRQFRF